MSDPFDAAELFDVDMDPFARLLLFLADDFDPLIERGAAAQTAGLCTARRRGAGKPGLAGGSDRSYPGAGVIADSSGNLYGMAEFGGSAAENGTVFKLTGTGFVPEVPDRLEQHHWQWSRVRARGGPTVQQTPVRGAKTLPRCSGPDGVCNEAGFKKTGISFTWRTCEKSYQNVSRETFW